ncbi:bifunctional diaminohydroxyphosphoribosylaminopyrimidine deaminase/5-amino-6-(5-phosphoribosylamino)uracil reductase RibD [Kocuria sp. TGY1127_2]|uniref:bifunctional diaminohydroxyphosphoribosylaminopyrimidine deaminase/5-amino-6-(5-phosphoribosylamino)uracil reductase RibD n=1 Tax=Kocuria sp. TGY1127_2 TaxID=2711328 RepID=UPI001FAC080D|nr:bifunctional diaminohydroxyphosphoribosylaminopyrimidine deaminase/5-amino-6-(5-phosphoribosylamino)uracil reductase RibD [Kocuria sp. TGY1127_2]
MAPEFDASDQRAMTTALDVALCGPRGANPLVGAVLVDESGRILHTGRHLGRGSAHAEADLIASARAEGTDMRGTTLYVTLEPCNHVGRTGPCSHAILDSGIRKVVYAESDTTSNASGGGRFLARHGVDVRSGLLSDQAHRLNVRWWEAQRAGRPFVTAKVAASLDGFVAAQDGTSQWITGPESRNHGHRIRNRVDTVLVGTGTVLADDPRLTTRTRDGVLEENQPRRAVMGLRHVPEYAAIHLDAGFTKLDTRSPREALERLARDGARHVLVEGGPGIVSAFLADGVVDEMYWYTAPMLFGTGRSAVGGLETATLSDAHSLAVDAAGSEADGTTSGIRLLGQDTLTHLAAAPAANRKK